MKKNFALSALAAIFVAQAAFTGCNGSDEPRTVKVTGVTLSPSTAQTIEVGGTVTLTATVAPADAADKTVTWSATPAGIVTVTNGVVKGDASGEATVKATTTDGGFTAEVKVTVKALPTVTITPATNLSVSAVNEIKYSEAVDAEGKPAKDLSVKVAANYGIGAITLKLTTDAELINGALTEMGLAAGFELGTMPAAQAGALAEFMPGLPTGDAVKGKEEVTLNFSAILPLVTSITGGVGQFDIEIKADGADKNGDGKPDATSTATLKFKFVDDLLPVITGDGIGETPLEIKASEAGTKQVKVNIGASQGIENFKVLISSSSAAFVGGLTALNLAGEFDLANPDPALAGTLAALAAMTPPVVLPSGEQVKGQTKLEFDISSFIPMIFGVKGEGECTADFKLTVTDKKGNEETKTIALKLVD